MKAKNILKFVGIICIIACGIVAVSIAFPILSKATPSDNEIISDYSGSNAQKLSRELLDKDKATLEGYLKKYIVASSSNTSTSVYSEAYSRIFCNHLKNGGQNNWLQVLDILDIGFDAGDNNGRTLKSPTYIYSYRKKKAFSSTNAVAVFLAQQAHRATNYSSSDSRVTIDVSINSIINDLTASEIFTSDEKDSWFGRSTDGYSKYDVSYDDSENSMAVNWAKFVNDSAYNSNGKYDRTLYDNTKNVGSNGKIGIKGSTKTEESTNVSSGGVVGPFCLTIPNVGVKTTQESKSYSDYLTVTDGNNNSISYSIQDESGNSTTIKDQNTFYLAISGDIPDAIKFNFKYDQYWGRYIITRAGVGQGEWLVGGGIKENSSSVKYTIVKDTDISANIFVKYAQTSKGTKNKDEGRASIDRKSNPFYAEEGDILKIDMPMTNISKTNATISKINGSFSDSKFLRFLSQDEMTNVYAKLWGGDFTDDKNNAAWNNSNTSLTAEKYWSKITESNPSGYSKLSSKTIEASKNVKEYLMLEVQEQYDNITSLNSDNTVRTIGASVDKDNISPDDKDLTNNESTEYVRLKKIRTGINKTVKQVNGVDVTDDSMKIVEYGDKVTYTVKISNEGTDSYKDSIIYNAKFEEEIPEGLEFVSASTSNGSYEIKDDKIEYTISSGLAVKSDVEIDFTYKVVSFGANVKAGKDYEEIKNTASFKTVENRNEVEYSVNQSSSDTIYVKGYSVSINKYIIGNVYGTGDFETYKYPRMTKQTSDSDEAKYEDVSGRKDMSISDRKNNPYYSELEDNLIYRIEITNNGTADIGSYYFGDEYDNGLLKLSMVRIVDKDGKDITSQYNWTAASNNTSYWYGSVLKNPLAPGETFYLELGYTVKKQLEDDESIEELLIENTAFISRLTNSNDEIIYNSSKPKVVTQNGRVERLIDNDELNNLGGGASIETKEYTRVKYYQLEANKYISGYGAEIMNENLEKGLITQRDEYEDYYENDLDYFISARKDLPEEDKEEYPFSVEQNETIEYTIEISNIPSEDGRNNAKMYLDYAYDYMAGGLELDTNSIEAKLTKSGKTSDYDISYSNIDKDYTSSTAFIFPGGLTLDSGDSIKITYKVKMKKSNMNLEILKNDLIIPDLYNRNKEKIISQDISKETVNTNLNREKTHSTEYVKLKEIVIAGYVWNDLDKNGYKGDEEPGVEGVYVNLNGLTEDSRENRYTTVVSNSDGLYTFGRVFRTDENEKYEDNLYISYIYDGIKYQSTVYSGKDNLVYLSDQDIYYLKPNYKIDSNAKEFDETSEFEGGRIGRIDFNNNIKMIYYNHGSKNIWSPDQDDIEIAYDQIPRIDTELFTLPSISSRIEDYSDSNSKLIEAYSFIYQDEEGNEDVERLWLGRASAGNYSIDYLKFINLGLVSRDLLDLSVKESLDSITNTVFGDTLKYEYDEDEESVFKYYEADYHYEFRDYQDPDVINTLGPESELTSRVTYKVELINSGVLDPNVNVEVNELGVYLDKKYQVETDVTGVVRTLNYKTLNEDEMFEMANTAYVEAYYLDNKGNKVYMPVFSYSNYNPGTLESDDYTSLYIRTEGTSGIVLENEKANKKLTPREVYITFVDYNRSLPNNHKITLDEKYNNVVEITAYSTYYKEDGDYFKVNEIGYNDSLEKKGMGAGYVDIDSNPGNIGTHEEGLDFFGDADFEKMAYDEDDTGRGEILLTTGNPTDDPDDPGNPDDSGDPDDSSDDEVMSRKIYGFVFNDARSEAVGDESESDGLVNVQYIGDGLYSTTYTDEQRENIEKARNVQNNTEDKKIVNIKTRLCKTIKLYNGEYIEIDLSNPGQYKIPSSLKDSFVQTMTDQEGEFVLSGFTPGTYFVRFEYGNNETLDNDLLNKIIMEISDEEELDVSRLTKYPWFKTIQKHLMMYQNYNSKQDWYDDLVEDFRGSENLRKSCYNADENFRVTYERQYLNTALYKLVKQVQSDIRIGKVDISKVNVDFDFDGLIEELLASCVYSPSLQASIIYNGQDFKSTVLADLKNMPDTYYNLTQLLENTRYSGKNANQNPLEVELEGNLVVKKLVKWLLKYYKYNDPQNWYNDMIDDYYNDPKEGYLFLWQGFANQYIPIEQYYLDNKDSQLYQLLTKIGQDTNNGEPSEFTGFDILTIMNETLSRENLLKVYRNSIINYISKTEGSNALDDARRRLEVTKFSSSINNEIGEILASSYKLNYFMHNKARVKDFYGYTDEEYENAIREYSSLLQLLFASTHMYADSIEFYVRTENVDYNKDTTDEFDIQSIKMDDRREYRLKNLGFGIQYRPETELTLKEYIKELKVVDSAQGVLVSISFNEDKSINTEQTNINESIVQQLDSEYTLNDYRTGSLRGTYNYDKGFKFISLDEDAMHGANIYVTYGMYVENTGEVDRLGKNLYSGDINITKSEYLSNLNNAIDYYDIEYYGNKQYSDCLNNGIIQALERKVNTYQGEDLDLWFTDIVKVFHPVNTPGSANARAFVDAIILASNYDEYLTEFLKYIDLEAQHQYIGIYDVVRIDETKFNKAELISKLKESFANLRKQSGADYHRRLKKKDYADYYLRYLGNTYYTGNTRFRNLKNNITTEDTIAKSKVDQVINDIDQDIGFNINKYNQEWTYIENIYDLFNSGSYYFWNEYNLSGKSFENKKKFNNSASEIVHESEIMVVLRKYLDRYTIYENSYGKDAFRKWYIDLNNEVKSKAKKQEIANVMQGLNYYFSFEKLGDKTLIIQLFDDFMKDNDYKYDYNSYCKILKALGVADKTSITQDEFYECCIQNNNFESQIIELRNKLNSLNELVVVSDEDFEYAKITNSKELLKGLGKAISREFDTQYEGNEYNTTYRFTEPLGITYEENLVRTNEYKQAYTLNPDIDTGRYTRVSLDIVTELQISSDILNFRELNFDNSSEVISYTSMNGRRTCYTTTVGNGKQFEVDSDETVETITFSKPTGLSEKQQKAEGLKEIMIIVSGIGIVILLAGLGIRRIKRIKK